MLEFLIGTVIGFVGGFLAWLRVECTACRLRAKVKMAGDNGPVPVDPLPPNPPGDRPFIARAKFLEYSIVEQIWAKSEADALKEMRDKWPGASYVEAAPACWCSNGY